jgi:hypothetical protein
MFCYRRSEMFEICRISYDLLAVNKCGASGDTNVDIFTMLSRAQEDYKSNKNQANSRHAPTEESKPEMPQGVMHFFFC